MLTPAQWASVARVFIQWACIYLVSRGLMTAEQAEYVSDPVMLATVIGGIGAVVTLVAGVYARRPAALVKEVTKLPEVSYVAGTPELAAKVPGVEIDPVRAPPPEMGMNNPYHEPPYYKNG